MSSGRNRVARRGASPACIRQPPNRRQAAQAGLPGVEMALDNARQQQHVRSIDDIRIIGGNLGCDHGNTVLLDANVAHPQIPDCRVHADNGGHLD
jgi:hypothetical protein